MNFLMIKVIFEINELVSSLILKYNSFIVKLKKNVLTETHKKNWAGKHSELLYWKSNGQFKSKMNLPLEKVSKIPLGALTNSIVNKIGNTLCFFDSEYI